MKTRLWLIISAFILLNPFCVQGKDIGKEYRKQAKKYGFKLEERPQFRRNITGTRISVEETESELERFFTVLSVLPPDFVKNSGIVKVMICRDLKLNNTPAGGVVSGDCIYLNAGFGARTVYHELFHVFDPVRNNKKWTRLNNKKFYYQGSNFYPQKDNRKNRKRKEKAREFQADFASSYAQSFEWEDRAETFAFMIVEKDRFIQRTLQSQVLRNKMCYIIEITSKRKLLGKDFWENTLGITEAEMPR